MKIYDEITNIVIEHIDLKKGYTYSSRHQIGIEPEHIEIIEGLRHLVEAKPIYEDCLLYHAYTNEELIQQYKNRLKELDYIGIKIATGRATKEEYAEEIQEMNELANKINELEMATK